MSQVDYDPIPPTPRAQRMAEAEAIYQLLRVIAKDPEGFGRPLTGKVTVEQDLGGGWKHITEIQR